MLSRACRGAAVISFPSLTVVSVMHYLVGVKSDAFGKYATDALELSGTADDAAL
jgi:hypothetical protein